MFASPAFRPANPSFPPPPAAPVASLPSSLTTTFPSSAGSGFKVNAAIARSPSRRCTPSSNSLTGLLFPSHLLHLRHHLAHLQVALLRLPHHHSHRHRPPRPSPPRRRRLARLWHRLWSFATRIPLHDLAGQIFLQRLQLAIAPHFFFHQRTASSALILNAVFGVLDALLGAAFGAFLLWAAAFLYKQVRKREGMGMGDVKMMAMVGAFLGITGTFLTILIGTFIGSILGLAFILAPLSFPAGKPISPSALTVAASAKSTLSVGPSSLNTKSLSALSSASPP